MHLRYARDFLEVPACELEVPDCKLEVPDCKLCVWQSTYYSIS
jgi:hypothetical protein